MGKVAWKPLLGSPLLRRGEFLRARLRMTTIYGASEVVWARRLVVKLLVVLKRLLLPCVAWEFERFLTPCPSRATSDTRRQRTPRLAWDIPIWSAKSPSWLQSQNSRSPDGAHWGHVGAEAAPQRAKADYCPCRTCMAHVAVPPHIRLWFFRASGCQGNVIADGPRAM